MKVRIDRQRRGKKYTDRVKCIVILDDKYQELGIISFSEFENGVSVKKILPKLRLLVYSSLKPEQDKINKELYEFY